MIQAGAFDDGGLTARDPLAVERRRQVCTFDKASFEAFYAATAPKLLSYIRRVSGDEASAEDIFQEAFYRLLHAPLSRMDEAQKRGYLYRTATTLVCDDWRRAKRRRRWRSEPGPGLKVTGDPTLRLDMKRAFAQLKPQDRALLWLAYVEGAGHQEIAKTLGLRRLSVRVLLFRARKKMAQILRRHSPTEEEAL